MAARILPGEITPEVLKSLIGVAEEGQTLDFKRSINVENVEAKRNLAIDVTSFANESGGDIVFGIAQTDDGVAKDLVSLDNFNADSIELQLRQVCSARIDPPVPGMQFVPVEFEPGKSVMVMRIPRSSDRPHCVVGDNNNTWHVRDGKGNRSMKARELRDVFLRSAQLVERMRGFRIQRVSGPKEINFPVSPTSPELLMVHVLPLSAFDSSTSIDLDAVLKEDQKLAIPLGYDTDSSLSARYNFEGAIIYRPGGSDGNSTTGYTQLFRDGCIESLNARILQFRPESTDTGITSRYEFWVEASVRRFVALLQKHRIDPPIYVLVSILGGRGRAIGWKHMFGDSQAPPSVIDRDPLFLPEVRIEAFGDDYYSELKPTFDVLWQCCGLAGSANYTGAGWSRPPESELARRSEKGFYV